MFASWCCTACYEYFWPDLFTMIYILSRRYKVGVDRQILELEAEHFIVFILFSPDHKSFLLTKKKRQSSSKVHHWQQHRLCQQQVISNTGFMPVWSRFVSEFISVRWIQIKRPLAQSDLDKKHQVSVQTSASEAAYDAECHQNQMFGCKVGVCVCLHTVIGLTWQLLRASKSSLPNARSCSSFVWLSSSRKHTSHL